MRGHDGKRPDDAIAADIRATVTRLNALIAEAAAAGIQTDLDVGTLCHVDGARQIHCEGKLLKVLK